MYFPKVEYLQQSYGLQVYQKYKKVIEDETASTHVQTNSLREYVIETKRQGSSIYNVLDEMAG